LIFIKNYKELLSLIKQIDVYIIEEGILSNIHKTKSKTKSKVIKKIKTISRVNRHRTKNKY